MDGAEAAGVLERLTLAEACDVVHALWVQRIEADVRVSQQVAVMAAASGGKPEWPSLDDAVADFEARLVAEPKVTDPADMELRAALGLRRHGG